MSYKQQTEVNAERLHNFSTFTLRAIARVILPGDRPEMSRDELVALLACCI